MKFANGIQALKDSGLNIFVSADVLCLPDQIFPFSEIQKEKTLCLIGNGGTDLWEKLPHPLNIITHPIDQYSKNKMIDFAESALDSDIEILFPNDSYTLPLQKIARALNLSSQSPIGIDINHDFGLWFAIRGVFLTSKKLPTLPREKHISPCDTCNDKPCLLSASFAQARLNCPIKCEHKYQDSQIKYHQKAVENSLKFISSTHA